jgi:hypothetical protein
MELWIGQIQSTAFRVLRTVQLVVRYKSSFLSRRGSNAPAKLRRDHPRRSGFDSIRPTGPTPNLTDRRQAARFYSVASTTPAPRFTISEPYLKKRCPSHRPTPKPNARAISAPHRSCCRVRSQPFARTQN